MHVRLVDQAVSIPNKRFSFAASPALYRIAKTVFGSLGWLAAVAKGAKLAKDVVLWFTRALPAAALLNWRKELANMVGRKSL